MAIQHQDGYAVITEVTVRRVRDEHTLRAFAQIWPDQASFDDGGAPTGELSARGSYTGGEVVAAAQALIIAEHGGTAI